jgi:hypothetical protein
MYIQVLNAFMYLLHPVVEKFLKIKTILKKQPTKLLSAN